MRNIIIFAVLLALAYAIDRDRNDAKQDVMAVCQLSHTFDTCFDALNN